MREIASSDARAGARYHPYSHALVDPAAQRSALHHRYSPITLTPDKLKERPGLAHTLSSAGRLEGW